VGGSITDPAEVRRLFQLVDDDGSGAIDVHELHDFAYGGLADDDGSGDGFGSGGRGGDAPADAAAAGASSSVFHAGGKVFDQQAWGSDDNRLARSIVGRTRERLRDAASRASTGSKMRDWARLFETMDTDGARARARARARALVRLLLPPSLLFAPTPSFTLRPAAAPPAHASFRVVSRCPAGRASAIGERCPHPRTTASFAPPSPLPPPRAPLAFVPNRPDSGRIEFGELRSFVRSDAGLRLGADEISEHHLRVVFNTMGVCETDAEAQRGEPVAVEEFVAFLRSKGA
jgi:hypothetical protein